MASMADSTTIAFTLDGEAMTALAGESLLTAAKRHGVDIPHLCAKEGLRPDGNCRACVVEIDGERVLAPSCCREPTEGMIAHSSNKRARKSQRLVVELLKADRPSTAYSLKNELDDWADLLQVGESRFPAREQPGADISHPAIAVNLDACIRCTRCLRACREEQDNGVIGYARRGDQTPIVFDPRRTPIAEHATHYLQFKPDTDVALLNALMHAVIEQGLVDQAFVDDRTSGFAALVGHLKPYTPEKMAPICGIDAAHIMGENPAMSDPNLNHARTALSRLEHRVVQDIFMTETAWYADVILPASAFAEKTGSFTTPTAGFSSGGRPLPHLVRRGRILTSSWTWRTGSASTGTIKRRQTSSPRCARPCRVSLALAGNASNNRAR